MKIFNVQIKSVCCSKSPDFDKDSYYFIKTSIYVCISGKRRNTKIQDQDKKTEKSKEANCMVIKTKFFNGKMTLKKKI